MTRDELAKLLLIANTKFFEHCEQSPCISCEYDHAPHGCLNTFIADYILSEGIIKKPDTTEAAFATYLCILCEIADKEGTPRNKFLDDNFYSVVDTYLYCLNNKALQYMNLFE